MKIIVRVMGLTVIGLCISLMLMHSFDVNIRLDELEKISSIAMSNTQLVMMENIEDVYYGTNNARKINNDVEYISLYKKNLEKLITTNSDYRIVDYLVDSRMGLLYVDVECNFTTLKGEKKTFNKKLLNVIDVDIKDEENN